MPYGVNKLTVKICVFMIIFNDLIKDKHKLQKSTVNVNNEHNNSTDYMHR